MDITVITLSRNRPVLLKRAISSVKNQDYEGKIHHLILIDDCWETASCLKDHYSSLPNLIWVLRGRRPKETSGPIHLAQLRNLGIRMAETEWVCFLDDDNEFEPFHLSKLLECAQANASPAVHSWIKVFNFDGTPYLKKRWPWSREDKEGEERYKIMAERGAVIPGSHTIRDSIHNLPYRCVDTSAWLIKRELLIDNPISNSFSYEEWRTNKAEDDKLQMGLMKAQVSIHCNELASLRYYLGGYSTNHDGSHTHSEQWKWKDIPHTE